MREDQVRELLGLAGETIEVTPGAPAEAEPRRRWPYVAGAAAAAVAIAASVMVGVALDGDRRDAAPAPAVELPSPDELPLSAQHYELDDDQVPFLIGWKVDQARAELVARGYRVEVHEDSNYGCHAPGRVYGTEPVVGTRPKSGETVTLAIPGLVIDCAGERTNAFDEDLAWRLIDFAEGRGPLPPEISGDLTLWLGPNFSRTITAEEAEDPANWVICSDNGVVCGSALHDLVEFKYAQREGPIAPSLEIEHGDGSGEIHGFQGYRDVVLAGREATRIAWYVNEDGYFSWPSVDLFRTDDDRIDAASTWTGLNPDGTAGVMVPEIVGLQAEQAWEALLDLGFDDKYDVRASDECGEGRTGEVLGVEPPIGTVVRRFSRLDLTLCRTTDISAPPDDSAVGRAFIGTMDPDGDLKPEHFGATVALYLGNELVTVIPDHAVNTPGAWDVCPASQSYAERECPFSARDAVLRVNPEGIQVTHRHPATPCLSGSTPPPDRPGEHFLVLGPHEYDCMSGWFVELYYDDQKKITAVNLLIGSP